MAASTTTISRLTMVTPSIGAAELDERPALVDFVDPVHGPAKRADVAGGGPQSASGCR